MKNYTIYHTDALRNTLESNGYKLMDYSDFSKKQLRSMQAWEVEGEVMSLATGELLPIKILQSYCTLVAYKLNGETVRCGYWSRTTSKQTGVWSRC